MRRSRTRASELEAISQGCANPTRNAIESRARRTAAFIWRFYGLRKEKRNALCALYAFMRLVDDVSDEPGDLESKRAGLARWRAMLDEAVAGRTEGHAILPALADTISRFEIPTRYFHDLILGAEMDLTVASYATFDRLSEYCYRVAGTVGLDLPARFRFSRSAFAGSGRAAGARVSIDEYHSRRSRAISKWAACICRRKISTASALSHEELRGPVTPKLQRSSRIRGRSRVAFL